ncbi:MAG: ABC transporter substrate-binding protein [Candidatus Methanoplasma sp.]|nr:ABC transporter substrate-binding protein [Candidatus Methanoplasma sp.]
MNIKIIAAVIVVILVAAGVGAFVLLQEKDKDKEINILAEVNTDGSGIYIDSGIDENTMFDYSTTVPTPIKSGWEGKIFGTPGTATIQHVQLLSIVEGMGMTFAAYTISGGNSAPNTVYYTTGISNASLALGSDIINGGSLWQPQFQKIIDDKNQKRDFKKLALTNELFPGHVCCVIAGYHGYTSTHENETARFLAAYVKATDWVNSALSNKTGADYALLISIAKDATGSTFTEAEIKAALDTVVYDYGEHTIENSLVFLRSEIASLAENLVQLGQTPGKTLSTLGFNNGAEFAEKFVDNSFLMKAYQLLGSGGTYSGGIADLRVAVISGDIHQISVHVAKELGYFTEYGLNVTFSPATNGPGVATAIQNGDASFGLLGAPPLTTTVINGELVKA